MPILKDEKRLASLPPQDELFSLHKGGSANGTFYFPLTIRKSNRLGDYYFALPIPYDRHPYMLVSSLLHLKKKR